MVGCWSTNLCDWQKYSETQDSKPRELDVVKSVVDKTGAEMIGATRHVCSEVCKTKMKHMLHPSVEGFCARLSCPRLVLTYARGAMYSIRFLTLLTSRLIDHT